MPIGHACSVSTENTVRRPTSISFPPDHSRGSALESRMVTFCSSPGLPSGPSSHCQRTMSVDGATSVFTSSAPSTSVRSHKPVVATSTAGRGAPAIDLASQNLSSRASASPTETGFPWWRTR